MSRATIPASRMNSLEALRIAYRLASRKAISPEQIRPHLKILDKQQRLIPFIPNAIQEHYRAHRTGRDLTLKPRQVGFSTLIEADTFTDAITSTVRGATLAHDDRTTQLMRELADRFYVNLPERLRPARTSNNNTVTRYAGTDSAIMIATAGNPSSGIGGTYNRIHGTEVAYWTHAREIMNGIMQGVPEHGIIELESAANGAQGWFYETFVDALNPKNKSIWSAHFYPWFWEEGYQITLQPGEALVYEPDEQALVDKHGLTPEQIAWRRAKQKELGADFPQSYPEDPTTCFLTSGSTVFTEYTLYTPLEQAALDEHLYVLGIDWSGGGSGDADSHAVSIVDATDYREVFCYTTRQRDDDAVLLEIVELAKRWKVITLMPEANSMGTTLSARLFRLLTESGYDWGKNKRGESLEPVVYRFVMTNPEKDNLVKAMKLALKAGYKLVDDPTGNDELLSFQSRQLASGLWTYGAKSGKHDDLMVARLLALRACKGY